MPLQDFKKSVLDLRTALLNAKEKGISTAPLAGSKKLYDFSKSKEERYRKAVEVSFDQVVKHSASLHEAASVSPGNAVIVDKIRALVAELDIPSKREAITSKIIDLFTALELPKEAGIKKPAYLPAEIRQDLLADIAEAEKAFNSGCYRSAAILCGRILEVALHRKYFEATGTDLLEKSPGIGLGKIVAKLAEKSISFDDPGLMQQIHLINNIRISSVHIRQEPFSPTKSQAQAMILYTLDILDKIFKPKK